MTSHDPRHVGQFAVKASDRRTDDLGMDTCSEQVRWDYTQLMGTTGSTPPAAQLRAEVAMLLARRDADQLGHAIEEGDLESALAAAHRASEILLQRRALEPYLAAD